MNASRSMLLGLVLSVATGCSSSRDTANTNSNLGSVSLKVQIGNSNGLTLSSVAYDIVGPSEYAGTLSSPAGSHSISGRIGQIVPGTYRMTLTGHPDTEPAIACTGASVSFTVEAGKAAAANVSLVCVRHVTDDGGLPTNGMLDVNGTAAVLPCCDETCPILLNDTASSLEIPADGVATVTLTGSASAVEPPAALDWSVPSGRLSASTGNTVTFTCNPSLTDSVEPVTLTVVASSPNNPQCPPSGDTINITCSGVNALAGSGGAGSTGGVGGLLFTGGAANAGIYILSNYTNGNPVYDCEPNCASGCRQFECTSQLCLDLLQCIMPPGGYHYGGSCYDYEGTNSAVSCYCGTADASECATGGGNGVCAAQETAAGMTPGSLFTGFTDTSTPAGKVNAYVVCLSITCGCFWGNGYNAGGGNSTGGTPGAGGSTSTGGSFASGGTYSTGGSFASGGTYSTGGSFASGGTYSTGGTTGSTAPELLSSIILAYTAGNPEDDCTPNCAQDCSQFTCTSSVCLDLLQCIMPPGSYHDGGSCYDVAGANTAVPCYCGTTSTGECSTVGGNGVCSAQETTAGMRPGILFTGFTDPSTPAGKVNAYVNCLSTSCGCFYSVGSSAGGGDSTGGAPGAGGSTSTGGSIASGGTYSTGGTAGSTAPDPLSSIILAYTAGNPEDDYCTPSCAQGCSSFNCTDAACLDLIQCIMPPGGYHVNGSCYDEAGTNTSVSCYCGAADSTTCTTVGGIGACYPQETAAGMTPEKVLTGFQDPSIPAGVANGLAQCLSVACGCFW